jgi:hypothetical protein
MPNIPLYRGNASPTTISLRSGFAYTLSAEAGALALNGSAVTLRVGRVATAAAGAIAATGQSAELSSARRVTADAGAITASGYAAATPVARGLSASVGAVVGTGHDAALRVAFRLVALAGADGLTGQAASLREATRLTGDVGALLGVGQEAGLTVRRLLTGALGTIALTGHDAAFVGSGSGTTEYTLPSACGEFLVNGQNASFTTTYDVPTVTIGSGSHDVWEWRAFVRRRLRLLAEPGRFGLRGVAAQMVVTSTQRAALADDEEWMMLQNEVGAELLGLALDGERAA